jgi:transcriptional regulator with XRE-family HTH domain
MSFGAVIRDLRQCRDWSQTDVATELCRVSGRPTISRDEVKRWESGKVIPGPFWIDHLSRIFDTPAELLTHEAKVSRMDRRGFLSLTALTAVHGKLAAEMTASIGASDFGPLTTVQTTHGADLVIASLVDRGASNRLHRWMQDGENAILRVNSAGILAKTPGQDPARQVARVLAHDTEVRKLYTTAVAARVCVIPWSSAARLAEGKVQLSTKQVRYLTSRFSSEVLNPRDAGARWCSAQMLQELSPLLGQDNR